jgi:hypothetical protein
MSSRGISSFALKKHTLAVLGMKAVPQFRWSAAALSQRRPGFEARSGHVGFVLDNVILEQVFN